MPNLKLQRPPLIATIIMLISIGILCSLGNWQIQRLEWKEGLISAIEQELSKPATPITDFELSKDTPLKRGTITGKYLGTPPIKIFPRTNDGEIGSHIYAPFITNNSMVIFIHQGWAPQNWQETIPPKGLQILTGLLINQPESNYFTPENQPDKDQWYHPKLREMAQSLNIKTPAHSVFFMLQGAAEETPPYPLEPMHNLKNDHKQYAFFWFTMAGVLMVIFGLRFMVRKD